MDFQSIALILTISGFVEFYNASFSGEPPIMVAVKSPINTFVIALAIFESGAGIHKEYQSKDTGTRWYSSRQRTIIRFVGIVCIALSLEALMMIFKYGKLKLVSESWYPVGIIASTSLLLSSLALFLFLFLFLFICPTRNITTPAGEADQ